MTVPKLALQLPETGRPHCPRCARPLGFVRYVFAGWDADTWGEDGPESHSWFIASRSQRDVPHSYHDSARYLRALILPYGWRQDAAGRWVYPAVGRERMARGHAPTRRPLPRVPGEPGIRNLAHSGWAIAHHEAIVVCECGAPLRVEGAQGPPDTFLVDLEDVDLED